MGVGFLFFWDLFVLGLLFRCCSLLFCLVVSVKKKGERLEIIIFCLKTVMFYFDLSFYVLCVGVDECS